MARHPVGPYQIEVVHHRDKPEARPELILVVFEEGRFVEMARFSWREFNSAEIRKRLKTLAAYPVQRLKAVLEDAKAPS